MIEVRFEVAGALDGGIDEAGAVAAERLEEGAGVTAVLGARLLIPGIKGAIPTIRPEVRAVPQIHQAEDAGLDAQHPRAGIAIEQMQFLESFENQEGEIDLDAMGVEDLAVEFVRQSFANQQLVDFGVPAHSRRCGVGIKIGSIGLAHKATKSAYLLAVSNVKPNSASFDFKP